MAIDDFGDFDVTPYQSAPMLTANGTIRLIGDLNRAKPANPTSSVVKAAERMMVTAGSMKARLLERVNGAAMSNTAAFKFDVIVDRFWADVGEALEHRMHYGDPALQQLSPARREKIDLEHRRSLALMAEDLYGHLFGLDDTEFLRLPFNEQVEQMATRLEFVHTSPSAQVYEDLLGDGLLRTLDVLQAHYDDMVHGRVMREKGANGIRDLRRAAQRHIAIYASAVLLMLDEDEPESKQIVKDALLPIKNARTRRTYSASSEMGEGDDGEAQVEPVVESKPDAE